MNTGLLHLLTSLHPLRCHLDYFGRYSDDHLIALYAQLGTNALISSTLCHFTHPSKHVMFPAPVMIPRAWKFKDLVEWCAHNTNHLPISLAIAVNSIIQDPTPETPSFLPPRPPPFYTAASITLGPPISTQAWNTDMVQLIPESFANSCYLALINLLLTILLTKGPFTHPPALLVEMVYESINSFFYAYNRDSPADLDLQAEFIRHLEKVVERYVPNPARSDTIAWYGTRGVIGGSGLTEPGIFNEDAVTTMCGIVEMLDEEWRTKGMVAVDRFRESSGRPQVPTPLYFHGASEDSESSDSDEEVE